MRPWEGKVLELLAERSSLWEAVSLVREWHEDLFRHSLPVADLAAGRLARELKWGHSDVPDLPPRC